jgi:hypothetical protein
MTATLHFTEDQQVLATWYLDVACVTQTADTPQGQLEYEAQSLT